MSGISNARLTVSIPALACPLLTPACLLATCRAAYTLHEGLVLLISSF